MHVQYESDGADLVHNVCICIHEQPLANTYIHLHPQNITCIKHMFTSIGLYLRIGDRIERIYLNDKD